MSIHTLISSNITEFGSLIAVLDELRIQWRHETEFYMKGTGVRPVHAIEAVIGNERVWIFQVEECNRGQSPIFCLTRGAGGG